MTMILSTSTSAFAANTEQFQITSSAQSRIIFDGTGSKHLEFGTKYVTIAHVNPSESIGFNAEIMIMIPNNFAYHAYNGVQMLDKYGNVLWEDSDAIPYCSYANFKCGKDVYTVQVKTSSGTAEGYAGFIREL